MGGNRARGALATLALSSVVLVAVVLAGNVSLPPLTNTPAPEAQGRNRSSFEVVDDVVIPDGNGDQGQPTGSGEPEEDVDVTVGPGLGGSTDDGGLIGLPPFGPLDPDPVPGDGEVPPLGPIGPSDRPTTPDPPVLEPEPPYVPPLRPSTGWPDEDGKHPHAKNGRGKRQAKGGKGRRGHPSVVIIRPGKGPKWRPSEPARQGHPRGEDKWSRAQPHPKQQAAPGRSSSGKAKHQAKPPRSRGSAKQSSSGSSRRSQPSARRGNGRRSSAAGTSHSRGRGQSRGHPGRGGGGRR